MAKRDVEGLSYRMPDGSLPARIPRKQRQRPLIVNIEDTWWLTARREAPTSRVDIEAAIRDGSAKLLRERVDPGSRVGVLVGSRGISRIGEVVEAVVRLFRARGCHPVLIPAMGSHGGATPAGQVALLGELGVDPTNLGVDVNASMDVEEIGRLGRGTSVYTAASALAVDAVIPISRVKPHSDFRAPIESGMAKMLAIGLGKEKGASSLHACGFESFLEVLPEAASIVLNRVRVLFGVARLDYFPRKKALQSGGRKKRSA